MRRIAPALLATMVAIAGAAGSSAQTLPAVELRAVGSALPAELTVRSFNCIGRPGPGLNLLDGTTFVAPGRFGPTTGGGLDCAVDEIQPAFEGRYVTLSTTGPIAVWRKLANVNSAFGDWPNVQLALSERLPTRDDLTAYDAGAGATAGPAIAVPFFVVPIALAYNPVYAVRVTPTGTTRLAFNVRSTNVVRDAAGNPIGGLRLSRAAYCRVLNGEIVNWNNPQLSVLNGGQSLQDPTDDVSRWSAEGVPIRLVGQIEPGGATNILARHLATVCTPLVALNKFTRVADALPYDPATGVDMRVYGIRAAYFPRAATADFAGSVNAISGAHYDPATDTILTIAGPEALGLYMTAPGSAGVAAAINSESPGALRPSAFDPTISLNGKFGYVPGDYVRVTAGRPLFSAALQQATGTSYTIPNAANAGSAVATILPPQTTASSGAWNVNDRRVNSGTGLPVRRANPLDWFDVLYSDPARSLAAPVRGYSITGVSNLFTYSCFASIKTQLGLGQFMGVLLGKVTRRADGTSLVNTTFRGTVPTQMGILPQSNLNTIPASGDPVPGAWLNAIAETFLKSSNQQSTPDGGRPMRLGDEKLWIQSRIPQTARDFDGDLANGEAEPNPACRDGSGA